MLKCLLGARSHTLPYKQSLKTSSWDFPEWNLIFAVHSPLISRVRFLMLKKAISVTLNLCLWFSSRSYQSGLGVLGLQDTSSGGFSSSSESQFHSVSWMLGPKEEFSRSWTDPPKILFNVQEELGSLSGNLVKE